MFDNYKKYDASLIEVILERLRQLYDVELKSDNYIHIKDKSYKLNYLKYIIPGSADIEKLIAIFKLLKEEQYLLIYLPLKKTVLTPSLKDNAFDELIEDINFNTKQEIIENKESFMKQMGEHDTYTDFPLLFKNDIVLEKFFTSREEEIAHYFINNVLLFPTNMNWFMFFDYDLCAIHFAYKDNILENIKQNISFKDLVYSANEVEQLINDAND